MQLLSQLPTVSTPVPVHTVTYKTQYNATALSAAHSVYACPSAHSHIQKTQYNTQILQIRAKHLAIGDALPLEAAHSASLLALIMSPPRPIMHLHTKFQQNHAIHSELFTIQLIFPACCSGGPQHDNGTWR